MSRSKKTPPARLEKAYRAWSVQMAGDDDASALRWMLEGLVEMRFHNGALCLRLASKGRAA
jgi:hypothetical protein